MKDSNNKRSRGFLTNAFGVAKKLSEVGLDVIQQVTANDVSKQNLALDRTRVIEGSARSKGVFEANVYENPQQLLRTHVPHVSRQLLGRHYGTIDRVANFVSPQFSDKVSDYFFDQLNTFTNNISSVDAVLDQAGIRDLEELTKDVSRSQRISKALAEQNKWIASVQGALTGATGVMGSTIDIPVSIVMSLRTIYQVGRSYGFELNKETEQDIVQFVFKQINLGLIAEKQAILMGLKAISNTLETHDVYQLQQLLGSSNDIEALKRWLTNEEGDAKWQWLNHLPKFSVLTKLRPVASASVGALYSWKLIDEVNEKAQIVFSQARTYLIEHKDVHLSPLDAYQKSRELIAQATPKIVEQIKSNIGDGRGEVIKDISEDVAEDSVNKKNVKNASLTETETETETVTVKKAPTIRARSSAKNKAGRVAKKSVLNEQATKTNVEIKSTNGKR